MGVKRSLCLLKPEVKQVFEKFVAALKKQGLRYSILETLRTQEVQDAYFAQGRKSPEEVNRLRQIAGLRPIGKDEAGRIITKVRRSAHQEGIAADIVPVLPDGSIPWNINTPQIASLWLTFGKLGKEAGLEWGGTWTPLNQFGIGWDAPHYQLTRR
jgi:D-alanyl-D-alanine dipeptidase